jgi:hypothetical protein
MVPSSEPEGAREGGIGIKKKGQKGIRKKESEEESFFF